MRIAIDVRRIRDFGIGTYIRNLLRAIGQLDIAHEFLLIGPVADKSQFRELPPNFVFAPHPTGDLSRLDHAALPLLIRGSKVDLTHIPLNRVPMFMPKPYVVTVHDLSSLIFDSSPGWLQEMRRFRMLRGLSRAARVIAVSNATKRDLVNMTCAAEEQVDVVYNAPDPSFFQANLPADARSGGPDARLLERRRILERYQIHWPFLLYAGHIRTQKNIPRLVEAFAVVRNELQAHPLLHDVRLLIIGDEISKHPEVRRAVIQSRVEHCVRFLGFVPFDTMRIFYEQAAAFAFPSLYEGFGLPPLEAMASGTPVLTSNVSALPEVVGDAALLVNPENVFEIARGIRQLLTDEDTRATLIARGRLRAAQFSWRTTAERVVEIYENAAARS